MRDDTLPHQIRLSFTPRGWIAVSCCCLKQNGGGFLPLASRKRWDGTAEVQAIWRQHVEGA